ncbi:hypothetical protein A0J61_03604 [Choanephora cucurbitarum]|uniref:Uncharacterized protein n=1 Tax=Choanephora cucurbitarum TaxID=101091 RepID=A0A1C7NH74_9FUNG|nr:hypothetical protein A0J61_03604 [Choanephora cucurbitarum]
MILLSVRINILIQETLLCFAAGLNKRIGMNQSVSIISGPVGYTYLIKKTQRVHVATKTNTLKLPMTKEKLLSDDTKEFLSSLYSSKIHTKD